MAHWGRFAIGKEALSSPWSSCSPFSSSYRTGCFAIVDVWDWSPLVVNEVSKWPGWRASRNAYPATHYLDRGP
jgi:hypothetical protein